MAGVQCSINPVFDAKPVPAAESGSNSAPTASFHESVPAGLRQADAPPTLPASAPPARLWWCSRPRLRWAIGALCVLLVATAITLIVLRAEGLLGGGGGRGGGPYTPLPYSQRQRGEASATPAFRAELHSWLLPAEQAAAGIGNLTADVIVIGAGMAGLRAAQVLAAANLSVLVLEARVRVWGCECAVLGGAGGCWDAATCVHVQAHHVAELAAVCAPPPPLPRLQDRVGGRISTLPFAGGYAELGPMFIWGADSSGSSSSGTEGGASRQGNPIADVSRC